MKLYPFQPDKLENLNKIIKYKIVSLIDNFDLKHFNKIWEKYENKKEVPDKHTSFFCELFIYYCLLKNGIKNIKFDSDYTDNNSKNSEKDIYFEYNKKKVHIECNSPKPNYKEKEFLDKELKNKGIIPIPRHLRDAHNKPYSLSKKFIEGADYKIFFVMPLQSLNDWRDIRHNLYEERPYDYEKNEVTGKEKSETWQNKDIDTLKKQMKVDAFNSIYLLRLNCSYNGSIGPKPLLYTNFKRNNHIKSIIFDSINKGLVEFLLNFQCCEEKYEDELKR